MANSTGKAARKSSGNRAACKRGRGRKKRRSFGKLPVSASRGNAGAFLHTSFVAEVPQEEAA
jgi:hypothetical protein